MKHSLLATHRAVFLEHLCWIVLCPLALGPWAADAASAPQIESSMAGAWREPANLHVDGEVAYVATSQGLMLLDVTDPAHPFVKGNLDIWEPFSFGSTAVFVDDGRAYLGSGSNPLSIIDVRDPAKLALIGTVDVMGYVNAIAVHQDRVYLSYGTKGLGMVLPDTPVGAVHSLLFDSDALGRIEGVESLAYVPTLTGLEVLDLSLDTTQGAAVGRLNLGRTVGVRMRANHAYLAMNDGLRVVDVTRTDALLAVGHYPTSAPVEGVAFAADILLIAESQPNGCTIRALSLVDPAQPAPLGAYDMPRRFRAMDTYGSYALVVVQRVDVMGGTLIEIVDFRDPSKPVVASRWEEGGAPELSISREAEGLVVRWGAAGKGWTLQRCAGPLLAPGWQSITGTELSTEWLSPGTDEECYFRLLAP